MCARACVQERVRGSAHVRERVRESARVRERVRVRVNIYLPEGRARTGGTSFPVVTGMKHMVAVCPTHSPIPERSISTTLSPSLAPFQGKNSFLKFLMICFYLM